jgi:hypothetical protein
MTKRIVVVALVTATWVASVWIAYCAGFTHQLSIATYQATLADKVQLRDQKMLLHQIDVGSIDVARQSLEERVRVGEELVRLHEGLPEIGPMDMLLAGFHPRELLQLARVARTSKKHESSSPMPSADKR